MDSMSVKVGYSSSMHGAVSSAHRPSGARQKYIPSVALSLISV